MAIGWFKSDQKKTHFSLSFFFFWLHFYKTYCTFWSFCLVDAKDDGNCHAANLLNQVDIMMHTITTTILYYKINAIKKRDEANTKNIMCIILMVDILCDEKNVIQIKTKDDDAEQEEEEEESNRIELE